MKKYKFIKYKYLKYNSLLLSLIFFLTLGLFIRSYSKKSTQQRLSSGLVSRSQVNLILKENLDQVLPKFSRVLTNQEEKRLEYVVESILDIPVAATLDGNRLNHQIGNIGLEQHLPRFPGDTVAGRDFPQAGITPGRGAWGYFSPSRAQLTQELAEMEKYYVAVQTLYLPDWKARLRELRDWYKYRKVIIINPQTGASVVAVVADAGPADWTGKQFGGSPLVMAALGLYPQKTKGKVIMLFVNDPLEQIPLGPVTYPFSAPKPMAI